MKFSFRKQIMEGDNIVVSLCPIITDLKNILGEEYENYELVNIDIARDTIIGTISLKDLGDISKFLKSFFENSEKSIPYYFCSLEKLPHIKKYIQPQEYRNNLFSLLFMRYADKNWRDYPIIIEKGPEKFFLHILYNEHLNPKIKKATIKKIAEEINNNVEVIFEGKNH